MSSLAALAFRRPSPFERVLSPVPPYRSAFRTVPTPRRPRQLDTIDAIDSVAVAAAPLMDTIRQARFHQLCALAHPEGLHVAPEVSLTTLFTLDAPGDLPGLGGAAKALRGKRVDFVLIDGAARPVLAMDDHGHGVWQGRTLRRDRLKHRVFEKAGIPLINLGAVSDWPQDSDRILRLLSNATKPDAPNRPAA